MHIYRPNHVACVYSNNYDSIHVAVGYIKNILFSCVLCSQTWKKFSNYKPLMDPYNLEVTSFCFVFKKWRKKQAFSVHKQHAILLSAGSGGAGEQETQ